MYAVRADLERLAIPARALESITEDQAELTQIIDTALEAASNFCNGYLNRQYTLPLTLWGDDLKRAVCIVAAYDLMCVKGYNPQFFDEQFRLRYEDILKWLTLVAKGEVQPYPLEDSAVPSENSPSAPLVSSDEKRGW